MEKMFEPDRNISQGRPAIGEDILRVSERVSQILKVGEETLRFRIRVKPEFAEYSAPLPEDRRAVAKLEAIGQISLLAFSPALLK